ncbi:MAG: hypothetical protein HY791_15200 [Deltaproteobacteria bacterium]|nr:hypothetical protein [Deltaproteobacteria bacterium]
MTWQRILGSAFSTAIFFGAPSLRDAGATQVRGVIDAPVSARSAAPLGYTRVRVAQPAKGWESEREEVAIVLEVKESARTPPAERVWKVAVEGLKLTPSVIACATDASSAESVEFTNSDEIPATISIGKEQFATLAPGETKSFKCQTAGAHRIRAKEWPHIRGLIFVPERLALTTRPGADGTFAIVAPQGTYELQVIGVSGVVHRQEVKIETRDVDLGRIDLGGKTAKPTEAPGSQKTGEEVP